MNARNYNSKRRRKACKQNGYKQYFLSFSWVDMSDSVHGEYVELPRKRLPRKCGRQKLTTEKCREEVRGKKSTERGSAGFRRESLHRTLVHPRTQVPVQLICYHAWDLMLRVLRSFPELEVLGLASGGRQTVVPGSSGSQFTLGFVSLN